MELELDELVNNIFNRQPKPAKSIQLQFIENLSITEIFEFLISFFTEGAKYKYGETKGDPNTKVDITKWTNKELDLMKKTNPLVVPRNEQVEKALKDACEENNMVKFNELNKILSEPYKGSSLLKKYQLPASDTNKKYVTFCGT